MLDKEKYARVLSGEEFEPDNHGFGRLDGMSVGELLSLRGEIDKMLPSTALRDMDLESELVLQYHRATELQNDVLQDERVPANQMAQVMNATASVLQQLVAMQTKFHTAERLKEIESRLIRALEKVAPEHLTEFFAWYESEEVE